MVGPVFISRLSQFPHSLSWRQPFSNSVLFQPGEECLQLEGFLGLASKSGLRKKRDLRGNRCGHNRREFDLLIVKRIADAHKRL